ncbi:hypothetical protein PJM40_0085 [Salmonella phage vB_SenP_UTK0002]|nr:hypothetical protein PJM40_0085 [Salmonella phage vB_SenP_UTK0002]
MRFIQMNSGPNRAERRKASHNIRRAEVKSRVAKRMDRPHKMDIIDAGYNKTMNFFFPA